MKSVLTVLVLAVSICIAAGHVLLHRGQQASSLPTVAPEATGLQSEIEALSDEIARLETRADALLAGIQLIAAVPEYEDDREWLEHQPQMRLFQQRGTVRVYLSVPETTSWMPADPGLSEQFLIGAVAGWKTPGELILALATELRSADWLGTEGSVELRLSALETAPDRAVGVIMQWGMADDSVAGADYRITMRKDNAGWLVEQVELRYHAARGVRDDRPR